MTTKSNKVLELLEESNLYQEVSILSYTDSNKTKVELEIPSSLVEGMSLTEELKTAIGFNKELLEEVMEECSMMKKKKSNKDEDDYEDDYEDDDDSELITIEGQKEGDPAEVLKTRKRKGPAAKPGYKRVMVNGRFKGFRKMTAKEKASSKKTGAKLGKNKSARRKSKMTSKSNRKKGFR